MPRRIADLVSTCRFSAPLEGARVGEASAGAARLVVRIGLWLDAGRVCRARYRATTCAALIAYAEVACEALESGADAATLDSDDLLARVDGVHPLHHGRAALVAAAVRAAHQRARGAAP